MKKFLLFLVLILCFFSFIVTLNTGETYVFSVSNLLNVMDTMPKLELTSVVDAYRNFSTSFVENIPLIGSGLVWIVNLGHALLVLATMILQGLVFVVHLITSVFMIS